MLAFMIQWGGERYHPGPINLLQPLVLLAVGAVAGVLLVPALERLVPRARRRMRARLRRRRNLRLAATAEQRARAIMSELCPHGWRAEITLFEHLDRHGHDDEPLPDRVRLNGEPRPDRVRLEWTELRDERGTPAVMRELWAPTVGAALQAMVADRQTDETLEQIEQGAVWQGAHWPEPE